MTVQPFRVVIVGAGPVGLYMAHALEKANIDYVLLEQQPTILSSSGQLLFTWPQTVRLFDQLGLYEAMKTLAFPMHFKKRIYGCDGTITSSNRFWDYMERSHGYPFMPMLRSDLIGILYNSLENKEKTVQTKAEVINIGTHADGVHVHLKDGTIIEGSIVLGADGVHSRTRQLLQNLAKDKTTDGSDLQDESQQQPSMVASFYGIFGRGHTGDLPIEPEVFFESRGAGAVVQLLATSDGRLQFVTLKALPASTSSTSVRTKYNAEETEAYAKSIMDVYLCPGVTFGDVWARADRCSTQLLQQEEGFIRRWHGGRGRVVLVGDAVHKSTSINGLGMTCGLHSAAALANLLQGLVRPGKEQEGDVAAPPSGEALEAVFVTYQREREGEVKRIWNRGNAMVREVTQQSWWNWFWDSYVLPWVDLERLGGGMIPSMALIRHGKVLKYVPFHGQQGRISWLCHPSDETMT